MVEVTESLRRINLLLQSLRALLECAARLEKPDTTLGSCVFLTEELLREFEQLMMMLKLLLPVEKPAND